MPTDDHVAKASREWLRRARDDLAVARDAKLPITSMEIPCFHAQQAVEKGLKAVLVSIQVDFPKTHSIGELAGLLEKSGQRLPEELASQAKGLTFYAVEARYPMGEESEMLTGADRRQAVEIAEKVVQWAETAVRGKK